MVPACGIHVQLVQYRNLLAILLDKYGIKAIVAKIKEADEEMAIRVLEAYQRLLVNVYDIVLTEKGVAFRIHAMVKDMNFLGIPIPKPSSEVEARLQRGW